MNKFRKIINPNLSHKGIPKTKKQIEAHRRSGLEVMLLKNPMKNPESVEKNRIARLGKKYPKLTLRNILNNPMKNPEILKKHTKNQIGRKNIKISMQRVGIPLIHLEKYQFTTKDRILNNPMKNPEIAKKNADARRLNFPIEVLDIIITEFNAGKSISQLAKDNKVNRGALSRLLKRNGIKINKGERIALYKKMSAMKLKKKEVIKNE